MNEKRSALIIANSQYKYLGRLHGPTNDAKSLAKVLKDPKIGGFEVQMLLNKHSYKVRQVIETFIDDLMRDELLLLYFSGHGIKDYNDEDLKLYFATIDTQENLLSSTAISANFINEMMNKCISKRQVLLLDCCFSGAFTRGMRIKADQKIGTEGCFKGIGKGRVVLTASDAIQHSFEEDKITFEEVHSIFTRALVDGLETGEADLNKDGQISINELYNYIFDKVTTKNNQQRPKKWEFEVEGRDIIIANVKWKEDEKCRKLSIREIDSKIKDKATVNKKYFDILHILRVPEDEGTFGNFDEFGYGNWTEWHGCKGLRPGYWVYVYPYWFIWKKRKN